MGSLVRFHDASDDLVVKEVGRHSRIDYQGLRVDAGRTGADQEGGHIGRFLGFQGPASRYYAFSVEVGIDVARDSG